MQVFVFLFIVLCESNQNLIPQAISNLIKSHHGQNRGKIDLLYDSDHSNILSQTLKLLSDGVDIKVARINLTNPKNNHEENYNNKIATFDNDVIFIFESVENYSLYTSHKTFYTLNDHSRINLFFYCEGFTKSEIPIREPKDQVYINYLIEENGKISLHAITMFTEHRCKVPQLVEINRFKNSEKNWETEKFDNIRIEHFHGCELVITPALKDMPFTNYEISEDRKSFTVEGILIKMAEALAKSLNFTIFYNLDGEPAFRKDEDWRLHARIVDEKQFAYFTLSDPFYSTSDVFIVPPGEPYTPWEILWLPFDEATWMWTAIFFGVAFLVILLIKISKSVSIYEFVIGTNVMTPELNVFAILMGIGQILLPQRNIPRFLFINFVIFCLIMRTAYQGKYFEFMTGDMRRKPVASVEELAENNFKVYVAHNTYNETPIYHEFDILDG